jgi:uncharacterized membrane protein
MNKGVRIAKGRFEAFSDGVFAIAITLLVLVLPTPKLASITEATVSNALLALWPQYLVYFASFATIGIMWFNHYALFHHVRYITYGGLVANLALLMVIAFLPFPTLLLGQYGLVPAAVSFYGLTLIVISICFNVLWYLATLRREESGTLAGFLRTRNAWNTLGPVVYAIGVGVSFISPIASIALFVILALFYIAPWTVRSVLAASEAAHGDEPEGVA